MSKDKNAAARQGLAGKAAAVQHGGDSDKNYPVKEAGTRKIDMPVEINENQPRNLLEAVIRGVKQKCPNCGVGHIFTSYLKVVPSCSQCNEELHHHRADDAPPYFTIMIVGHLVVPLVLMVETLYRPELWIHAALWLPLSVLLAVLALPAVKGALIGLQWALYMHGFDPNDPDRALDT